ncbi:MAG: protein-glutamate O-methyltransferase CheR [Candidatus Kapabacteria bacterium]|nr:protein-glutamate O-methyltransferase CheR [Candidatus Kapabacteria bacterium]
MSDAVFQKYRQFIYSQTGIYFSDNKKYLLESKVQKRLNASKINTFEEYLNHISSIGKSASERLLFYEAITINETYFFRSEQQVDAMENIVIDQLCKAKNSSGSFRVWSAASSSGEEAYTMSLLITDKMKHRYPSVDFSVVGTDISSSVVETAKRGIYREYAVRNIPPSYMQKYFNKQNDTYHLSDSVKRMASFSVANLFDSADLRQLGKFDVIFCCNVLIYFDMLSKQQVVSSLYDALNPGGYLFIGYSESLHGISNAFEVVHFPKVLAYRRP